MGNIKLSIVIATRGREQYCMKSINTMLSFLDKETEIVISDNSTTTIIKDYINGIGDNRIKYSFSEEDLTMSENFNAAIDIASGDYICMIGDDDIVLPSIYSALAYCVSRDLDCITQKKVINYLWPNEDDNGTLYLPNFSFKITKINFEKEYVRYIKDGCCINPRDYRLPALYHGIVKKEVLDRIKKDKGCVIGGISPDSYMAVILSQYIHSQEEVDIPFSVGGACSSSATVKNIQGKHCGELSDSMQYVANVNKGYKWERIVPNYYSIQTIWADSALHAVPDELKILFSIERLTSKAVVENRKIAFDIMKRTKAFIKDNAIRFNWGKLYALILVNLFLKIFRRITSKISVDSGIKAVTSIGEIDSLLKPQYGLSLLKPF